VQEALRRKLDPSKADDDPVSLVLSLVQSDGHLD
jgi:hypothetical protein